jgi:hypothetical protein
MSDENSWPGGQRHAMDQSAHEAWNAQHYPGTRQLCARCEEPTGRCEDDAIYFGEDGPLCMDCYSLLVAKAEEHAEHGGGNPARKED